MDYLIISVLAVCISWVNSQATQPYKACPLSTGSRHLYLSDVADPCTYWMCVKGDAFAFSCGSLSDNGVKALWSGYKNPCRVENMGCKAAHQASDQGIISDALIVAQFASFKVATALSNSHIDGGQLNCTRCTLEHCFKVCTSDSDCKAIDYDQLSSSCYIHSMASVCGFPEPITGVNHFASIHCPSSQDEEESDKTVTTTKSISTRQYHRKGIQNNNIRRSSIKVPTREAMEKVSTQSKFQNANSGRINLIKTTFGRTRTPTKNVKTENKSNSKPGVAVRQQNKTPKLKAVVGYGLPVVRNNRMNNKLFESNTSKHKSERQSPNNNYISHGFHNHETPLPNITPTIFKTSSSKPSVIQSTTEKIVYLRNRLTESPKEDIGISIKQVEDKSEEGHKNKDEKTTLSIVSKDATQISNVSSNIVSATVTTDTRQSSSALNNTFNTIDQSDKNKASTEPTTKSSMFIAKLQEITTTTTDQSSNIKDEIKDMKNTKKPDAKMASDDFTEIMSTTADNSLNANEVVNPTTESIQNILRRIFPQGILRVQAQTPEDVKWFTDHYFISSSSANINPATQSTGNNLVSTSAAPAVVSPATQTSFFTTTSPRPTVPMTNGPSGFLFGNQLFQQPVSTSSVQESTTSQPDFTTTVNNQFITSPSRSSSLPILAITRASLPLQGVSIAGLQSAIGFTQAAATSLPPLPPTSTVSSQAPFFSGLQTSTLPTRSSVLRSLTSTQRLQTSSLPSNLQSTVQPATSLQTTTAASNSHTSTSSIVDLPTSSTQTLKQLVGSKETNISTKESPALQTTMAPASFIPGVRTFRILPIKAPIGSFVVPPEGGIGPTILPAGWEAFPGNSVSGAQLGEYAETGDICFERCKSRGPSQCLALDYDSSTKSCWFHNRVSMCNPMTPNKYIYHVKLVKC